MKKSDSIIARIWRKLTGDSKRTPNAVDAKATRIDGTAPNGGRTTKQKPGGIEMLEGRIAPASLVNPSTITYVDLDGDQVTIKFSKDLFNATGTELTNLLNSVFKFSAGGIFADASADPGTPQQLQLLDLTKIPTVGVGTAATSLAAGVSITVSAVQADTLKPGATPDQLVRGTDGIIDGNGLTNVGFINAASSLNSFGLGKITVDGDLGQIDCGVSKTAVALKALKVNSLGAVSGTQPSSAGVESKITGSIGSLTVLTDVKNAYIHVVNGSGFNDVKAVGKIGNINIGGALIGNVASSSSSDNTGVIQTDSSIGSIKIGSGGADDGIIGGGGRNAGSIIAAGRIDSILVDGNLVGHDGANSGSILGNGGIGSVKVTGDLKIAAGATQGGAGLSASIESGAGIGSVRIDGSILAGFGKESGTISANGKIDSVTIGGDLVGNGQETGGIFASERLGSVSIGGDVRGGSSFFSGFIESHGDIGSVKIGGDLESGINSASERNAVIAAGGTIKSISIEGSLLGGKGISSASIHAGLSGDGGIGSLMIGKKIVGGDGESSASITAEGQIGKIIVNGEAGVAVQGGLGRLSASIFSGSGIDSIKLSGHVQGSNGDGSASIQTIGSLAKLDIAGNLQGGIGIGSGAIAAFDDVDRGLAGDLGKINISGSLMAGRGADSASVHSDGDIKALNFGAVTVGTFETGSAGAGRISIVTGLGSLHRGDVGSITVDGKMDGRTSDHSLIEIRGSLDRLIATGGISNGEIHVADLIGSISTGKSGKGAIEGNIENVLITAGSILSSSGKQALSIAKITVNGDVVGSQILAGYNLDTVGTNGDAQIGSVTVSGDWAASDLVAGVLSVNGEFGDSDDVAIPTGSSEMVSRIASLVINGSVSGTNVPDTDHFGFVAQQIGTVKVAGSSSPMLPADVSISRLAVA
jgi:hypothetical protein